MEKRLKNRMVEADQLENRDAPMILMCEASGKSWQVELWPDDASELVALSRGDTVITVPRETVFETYTVVV